MSEAKKRKVHTPEFKAKVAGLKPKNTDEIDHQLLDLIDIEYTTHPFYGSRRMADVLRTAGHKVNRKRVQRLMRVMGLAGMAPGPNTSRPHPAA